MKPAENEDIITLTYHIFSWINTMNHIKLDVRILFQTDFKQIVKAACLNLRKSALTSEECRNADVL